MATATSYQRHAVDPTDTVDPPAGGNRYTTLATWWAANKGSSTVAPWAKCYGGGDMGALVIDAASYTPTADYYTRVYPADGERHDGIKASGVGAYLTATNGNAIYNNGESYLRIEGLRLVITATSATTRGLTGSASANMVGLVYDGVLIEDNGNSVNALRPIQLWAGVSNNIEGIVRNCIVYGDGDPKNEVGITLANTGAGGTVTVTLDNNTVSGTPRAGIWYNVPLGTLTATSVNNVCVGCDADFLTSGSPVVTQDYCLSEDGTADDWGGAGNITGEAAADVFEAPASDLHLKTGSAAIGAGVNIYGSFTTDAVGDARPAAGAWDMGALVDEAAEPRNAIVERIAANLAAVVNEITEVNGFNQDLTAVRPTRLGFTDNQAAEDRNVLVAQGDAEPLDDISAPGDPALKAWRQPFVLIAFVIASDSATGPIETRINRVAADIQKKVMEDRGRGSLAIDTHVRPLNMMNEGPRFTGVVVNVEVDYRTPENDPYTKA